MQPRPQALRNRHHAADGSQSKKKLESGIELLKKKFNKANPAFAAAQREREERERELEQQKLRVETQASADTDPDGRQSLDRLEKQAVPPIRSALAEPSEIIQQNATALLSLVSLLYIGNLSPDVTEEILTKVFNKFGEVQSIKLMLPRNEEERRRRRNCGFVKYFTYESAYLAKETLREKHLLGMGLKLVWGKGIPQIIKSKGMLQDYQGVQGDPDLEMQFIESQLNMWLKKQPIPRDEQLIENAINGVEFTRAQEFQFNPQKIEVKIPIVLRDRFVIDKLAKNVSKHGYQYENEIQLLIEEGKLKDRTLIKLFVQKDQQLVDYYHWRAFSFFNCDSKRTWSQLPFQMSHPYGPIWVPPRNVIDSQRLNPAKYIKQKVSKEHKLMRLDNTGQNQEASDDGDACLEGAFQKTAQFGGEDEEHKQLPGKDRDHLMTYLRSRLCSNRRSVCEGMIFAIEKASYSQAITNCLVREVRCVGEGSEQMSLPEIDQIKALLYLISDILFNSVKITAAWSYKRQFELKMPEVIDDLNQKVSKINGRLSQKRFIALVKNLLRVWNWR